MPLLNDPKLLEPFMFSARHPECISDIHGCLTAYDCVRIYLTAKCIDMRLCLYPITGL